MKSVMKTFKRRMSFLYTPPFEGSVSVYINPKYIKVPADMLCCDKSSQIVSIIVPYAILSDIL